MLYRLKKDAHVRRYDGVGYITSTGLNKQNRVDASGAVFLGALSGEAQTLERLAERLLAEFKGVDLETILPDAREFYDNLAAEGFLARGESEAELDADDSKVGWNLPQDADTVNFFLPGLNMEFLGFNVYLAQYMQRHPERFMANIRPAAFYGSFNNAIWQGGRSMLGAQPSPLEIETAIQRINDAGVAVRYTYTNSLIEEKHLNDTYCNLTMELADNGMNEVLVNSPVLEEYLRGKYPRFKYILSTTACERNIDRINEATKRYDLVVMDFRDNHDIGFLERIQDKDKIEILVDDYCPSFCRFRKKHYEIVSLVNLYQRNPNESGCLETNRPKNIRGFYQNLEAYADTNLTFDDVYGKYRDMGFRNFKLVGRDDRSMFTFESYMYYLVRPEWRDRVRDELVGYYVDYIIRHYGGNKEVILDKPVKSGS